MSPQKPTTLGDLQQLIMLAVFRLGSGAYGAAIQREIEAVAGRGLVIGTIYVTLVRLEKQGMVESNRATPEPVPGGKAKRVFGLTPKGARTLWASREEANRMWTDVEAQFAALAGQPARRRGA